MMRLPFRRRRQSHDDTTTSPTSVARNEDAATTTTTTTNLSSVNEYYYDILVLLEYHPTWGLWNKINKTLQQQQQQQQHYVEVLDHRTYPVAGKKSSTVKRHRSEIYARIVCLPSPGPVVAGDPTVPQLSRQREHEKDDHYFIVLLRQLQRALRDTIPSRKGEKCYYHLRKPNTFSFAFVFVCRLDIRPCCTQ